MSTTSAALLQLAPAFTDEIHHIYADAAPRYLVSESTYLSYHGLSLGQVLSAGLTAPLNILRPDPPLPPADARSGEQPRPDPATNGLGVELQVLRDFSDCQEFGRHARSSGTYDTVKYRNVNGGRREGVAYARSLRPALRPPVASAASFWV